MAKYEYVDSQHNEPGNTNPVVKMCRWLQVSPSGFYHWRGRPQSATQARRHALSARVQHFFEDSEGTYGYRRIHADTRRFHSAHYPCHHEHPKDAHLTVQKVESLREKVSPLLRR